MGVHHYASISWKSLDLHLLTNSSDNFTNLFHEFFQRIFEKENKLFISSKLGGFFLSLPVEKEIIINIR